MWLSHELHLYTEWASKTLLQMKYCSMLYNTRLHMILFVAACAQFEQFAEKTLR